MRVNAIDSEWDGSRLLEIGLTEIDICKNKKEIHNTYSLPLILDRQISREIQDLTGWTVNKLKKQGFPKEEIMRRLDKYGCQNRLIIVDKPDELIYIGFNIKVNFERYKFSERILNVCDLFELKTGLKNNLGLDKMLEIVGLEFEGKQHRASDDSKNIARLFLRLMYEKRC